MCKTENLGTECWAREAFIATTGKMAKAGTQKNLH